MKSTDVTNSSRKDEKCTNIELIGERRKNRIKQYIFMNRIPCFNLGYVLLKQINLGKISILSVLVRFGQ